MNDSLVHIGQQANAIQQGGMGLDFGSKLFRLKPATININQPNTQVEGAVAGKLRISETGDQFDEMFVTLLLMPQERRDYYTGEQGQLNRSADNLMCFSRDMIRPHANAKVPQALKCDGCPKADWSKWRQTKRKEDIPPCDAYYYALFIDTVYKLPLQMYIRSKSKQPFEAGMQELARKFKLMQSQGLNPNIFDIRFRLSTKKITTGKLTSYVPALSDFKALSEPERQAFGDIYLEFSNRGKRQADDQAAAEAESQIDAAAATIDAEIVEPGSEGSHVQEGEIII
jgi:hypothetical protein